MSRSNPMRSVCVLAFPPRIQTLTNVLRRRWLRARIDPVVEMASVGAKVNVDESPSKSTDRKRRVLFRQRRHCEFECVSLAKSFGDGRQSGADAHLMGFFNHRPVAVPAS